MPHFSSLNAKVMTLVAMLLAMRFMLFVFPVILALPEGATVCVCAIFRGYLGKKALVIMHLILLFSGTYISDIMVTREMIKPKHILNILDIITVYELPKTQQTKNVYENTKNKITHALLIINMIIFTLFPFVMYNIGYFSAYKILAWRGVFSRMPYPQTELHYKLKRRRETKINRERMRLETYGTKFKPLLA